MRLSGHAFLWSANGHRMQPLKESWCTDIRCGNLLKLGTTQPGEDGSGGGTVRCQVANRGGDEIEVRLCLVVLGY